MSAVRWGEPVEARKAHAYAVEADDTPSRRRTRALGINPGTPQWRSLCRRWIWHHDFTTVALTDEEIAGRHPDDLCATCTTRYLARTRKDS